MTYFGHWSILWSSN